MYSPHQLCSPLNSTDTSSQSLQYPFYIHVCFTFHSLPPPCSFFPFGNPMNFTRVTYRPKDKKQLWKAKTPYQLKMSLSPLATVTYIQWFREGWNLLSPNFIYDVIIMAPVWPCKKSQMLCTPDVQAQQDHIKARRQWSPVIYPIS